MEAEYESEAAAIEALHITDAPSSENPTADKTEEVASEGLPERVPDDEDQPVALEEIRSPTQQTCLTVQPNRVLCGVGAK